MTQGFDAAAGLVQALREQHRDFDALSRLVDALGRADIDVVEPLAACLDDSDVDLRIQAALILGGRCDARAIPPLIHALDDADINVRFHAIEGLGAARATSAAPRLVELASSGDFFLAFPAIEALALIGDPGVAPQLVPLLANEMLRAAIAGALGQLGDELVVDPLVALLNEGSAPAEVIADALTGLADRYEARYGAAEQIANRVRRAIRPAGAQHLLDAVHRVASERLRGIARVMGWLNGPAVHRAMTRLIGHSSVRAQVIEALVRYGEGVVDLLIAQLAAEDLETRQAAVAALGRIGDSRATGALVTALSDPELAVAAAGALARIGDAAAFEPLLALLDRENAAVRTAAIGALNSIGHPATESRIAPRLTDPNPLVRESAVRIAGYFGYPGCAERVLACCTDSAEAVRRVAIEHVPLFDRPEVAAALVRALDTDTPAVRAAAAAALGQLEPADALVPLVRALGDTDPWVRYFAVRSIGRFRDRSAVSLICTRVGVDPAGHVRLAAIEALAEVDAPEVVDTLVPLVGSSEPEIVRAAMHALGRLADSRASAVLDEQLRSSDAWRRVAAAMAVGLGGRSGAVPALQSIASSDPDRTVAAAALATLASIAGRDDDGASAVVALIALTLEPRLREPAVAALSALPPRRTADVAAGLGHPATGARQAVVEALGRLRNPEASRRLEDALADPEPAVRLAAAGELRRLGSRAASRKLLALARTDPDADVRRAATLAITQQPADGLAVLEGY